MWVALRRSSPTPCKAGGFEAMSLCLHGAKTLASGCGELEEELQVE